MKDLIRSRYETHPLAVIVFCALFIRLLAAFFSEGYAFHDDHFDVIRVAEHWADGIPHWLESESPPKHSMIYAAANAALIWVMQLFAIDNPIAKTTILRIIHAFYSLLVITLAFKITERLSDRRNAIMAGWMLAVLWFMPYLSVKFLAELVCVPPVLGAFYLILKTKERNNYPIQNYLWSGALLGLAFTIRMHTILFAGALGLVLLFDKRWRESIVFTFGYLLVAGSIIGITDFIFFDYPFHYVVGYFLHNSEHAYNYISGSPFKFLLTTIGFLVPPISLFIIWGFVRKGYSLSLQIFLSVVIFFVFHSAFPNQQERFLLPLYPLLIIVGVIGWNRFKDNSKFWARRKKLYKYTWTLFWVVNIVAAFALALTFTKKDRIAPLYYFYERDDASSVLIEGYSVKQPPVYYMGDNWVDYSEFKLDRLGMESIKESKTYSDPDFKFVFVLNRHKTMEEVKEEMADVQKVPNYLVMIGDKDLQKRQKKLKKWLGGKDFSFIKVIYPSNYDRLLSFLNPRVHKNAPAYIYKIAY